jgi:DGQHR domain-containing protein
MATKRYQAIEVRQQPTARPMYMISASARELLEWCDVPRTKEDYMAGYQRVLTDYRVEEITAYLNRSPDNILPGAIIVAADVEYVSVANDGSNVFIDVRDDTRDDKTKLEELFGAFSTRLSNEELASADINFSSSDETDEYDDSEYPVSYLALLAKELQDALTRPEDLPPERKKAIEDYIKGVSKPGLIIDGQHRVIGAKNVSDHDVMLPVVVMHGLPHEE